VPLDLDKQPPLAFSVSGEPIILPETVQGWRVHEAVRRGAEWSPGDPMRDKKNRRPLYIAVDATAEALQAAGCDKPVYLLVPVTASGRQVGDVPLALVALGEGAEAVAASPTAPGPVSESALERTNRELLGGLERMMSAHVAIVSSLTGVGVKPRAVPDAPAPAPAAIVKQEPSLPQQTQAPAPLHPVLEEAIKTGIQALPQILGFLAMKFTSGAPVAARPAVAAAAAAAAGVAS